MTKSKLAAERRFESLALETNRFHAYAVVYADFSAAEAREFTKWIRDNGNTGNSPEHNLDLYFGVPADLLSEEL